MQRVWAGSILSYCTTKSSPVLIAFGCFLCKQTTAANIGRTAVLSRPHESSVPLMSPTVNGFSAPLPCALPLCLFRAALRPPVGFFWPAANTRTASLEMSSGCEGLGRDLRDHCTSGPAGPLRQSSNSFLLFCKKDVGRGQTAKGAVVL